MSGLLLYPPSIPSGLDSRLQDIAWICQDQLQQVQVPPPVPSVPSILHGPGLQTQHPVEPEVEHPHLKLPVRWRHSSHCTSGCYCCFRVCLLHTSELSSQLQSQILLYSSYFRVRDSLHPDHSPHINHISRFFSTQIITFPGFIPSKTTLSPFIQQEKSPKPAENSIFHICQKITCFDIFHLFCHFLRSSKITHFHKNTKNTIFHYFPIRWRFCDFHLFPQNAQNTQKWGKPQK